ncbi:MAG TPA: response regulator [Hanamia sp.]|nr:response regulator [Hanamia sp.]
MPKKTVLVYDDVEAICEVCQLILCPYYIVETRLNCVRLFEDIERVKPDIILMDYRMPVMNGDLAIRALQEDESTENIPVILFTAAYDLKKVIKRVKVAGVLKKPFNIEELKEVVDKYVR